MNDHRVMLVVAVALSAISFTGMCLIAALIYFDKSDGSIALLSGMVGTAFGSLATLLSSTRTSPAKTEISNGPNNPVSVTENQP